MAPSTLDHLRLLDALSEHIALLDGEGRIVAVNRGWLRFARENGGAEGGYRGASYLEVCRAAAERGSGEAAATLEGVRSVLQGDAEHFTLEYPCPSPTAARWFILNASRLPGNEAGAMVSHMDISRRKLAEQEVTQANRRLERHVAERTQQVALLAGRLIEAEQAERARVARTLHDGLQQELFAAQYALAAARQALTKADTAETAAGLAETDRLLREAMRAARLAAGELSPPAVDDRSLDEALVDLVREMRERYGLRVGLAGSARVPDPALRSFVYGVARELLFNVVKHAGVDEARLELRRDDETFVLSVEDEGRGLDAAAHDRPSGTGLGLKGMRARLAAFGGGLEVCAGARGGARVQVRLPVAVVEGGRADGG